ncbi:chemokine XC receptor 1-like isoform X1 [Oreochromis aureus]|uniref:G-protein coupled receptors family 1 profile domain-containing protein n=2 Tax=Oreochromis aureus TaxID=47969 RepID=A0AAZ1X0H0_OREAU|nr:chemokine XC receptor 1-like isoform X1 [Oreochromis aureus]
MECKHTKVDTMDSVDTTTTSLDSTSYSYDYDYDELCNKTGVIQFGAIFTPVFFSIVVILSIFGNILVLVVLVKFENLKSLTNTFILNLAVSDLFFTASLPFWAYYNMHGWTLGEHACKIVNFIFCLGFYSSGILLILMTAHRYIAVINPLSDIVSTTGYYSIVASAIIWVVSILVSSLAFAASKVAESKYCVYADSFWSLWGIYQQNVLFIITSVVFMLCCTHIMCRLLHPVQRRRNKTLKLIFILMVVFLVGWVPYNVVIFLQSFSYWPRESDSLEDDCQYSKNLDYALEITRLFAFLQCCLNPVIVGVKVKSHLKNLLKISGPPNNNNNSFHSRQNQLTVTSLTNAEELSEVL